LTFVTLFFFISGKEILFNQKLIIVVFSLLCYQKSANFICNQNDLGRTSGKVPKDSKKDSRRLQKKVIPNSVLLTKCHLFSPYPSYDKIEKFADRTCGLKET